MPITTETYNGFPAGMNLNRPPQELDPEEVRYMQDVLLDEPGLMRRRGPVQQITGYYEWDVPIHGVVTVLDPDANLRAAIFSGRHGDTTGTLDVVSDDGLSIATSYPWNAGFTSFPPNYPYHIIDTKAMLGGAIGGGVLVGSAENYNAGATQKLGYWYGANKNDYTTGTITFTRGNYTVTGSGTTWTTNIVPGMFLFGNVDDPTGVTGQTLLGVVRTVDSNTQVTLVQKLTCSGTAKSYKLTSVRGIMPRIAKGNITTTTSSTTVTGGKTKFRDWNLATGVWLIFRAADLTYVGKVSSVTTNISLTLAANAAIDMSNERFVAYKIDGDWSLDTWTSSATYPIKPGFITATYAERQWYANNAVSAEGTYRLWFSDPEDFEALDLADYDGDYIQVASSTQVNLPIQALIPCYNSLVVLKENEVAAVFGTSPTTFNVRKISDDGTLCGMSAQAWAGGVIWAGKDNINFFDGLQVTSLTEEKLGGWYQNLMRTFDPTKYRITSMINRDHYFLFIENCAPDFGPIKGDTAVSQSRIGIVINLVTRAIGTITNLNFRGSAPLPASSGWNTWYLLDVIKGPDLIADTNQQGTASTWNATGSTLTVESGVANVRFGSYSGKVVTNNSATGEGAVSASAYSSGAAVTAGTDYEFGMWTLTGGTPSLRLEIEWFQSGGTSISTSTQNITSVASSWVHTKLSATAPALAAWAICKVVTHTSTQSVTFYIDGGRLSTAANYKDYASGLVCDADDLFDLTGNDDFACDGDTAGPDLYVESRRFNMDDSLRLKYFKSMAMYYTVRGDALNIDVSLGLNVPGVTMSGTFAATTITWSLTGTNYATWDSLAAQNATWDILSGSIFQPKRIMLHKRDQFLGFRIWQNSAAVTEAVLGPVHIAFKFMRKQRLVA